MRHARSLAILCGVLVPATAAAQSSPPAAANKVDAKALLASGLRLLDAKDYLGALAVFKDAYARFPSARILLNIATTLSLLQRDADAANAYQDYLESADADPAKQASVQAKIAELDRSVGRLELAVTPPEAEVQINTEDWQPATAVARYRVPAGAVAIAARAPGFQPATRALELPAGQQAKVTLALAAVPVPEQSAELIAPTTAAAAVVAAPAAPRSRLGVLALVRIDALHGGAAGQVGLAIDVVSRLQLHAAAVVGPYYGGHGGASFAFLGGAIRPFLSAGLTIFASDGPRYAVRGSAGLEVQLGRHLALIAEAGVERVLNGQDTDELAIEETVFVPAVGVCGRL